MLISISKGSIIIDTNKISMAVSKFDDGKGILILDMIIDGHTAQVRGRNATLIHKILTDSAFPVDEDGLKEFPKELPVLVEEPLGKPPF